MLPPKKKKLFPYYIVRFKPSFNLNDEPSLKKFPYYIVRFKLWEGEKLIGHGTKVSILHSTI